MARPNKEGIDYFPLDVDFFEDEKILAISGEFAIKGEIITLRLLCEIYRNGYFVEYSELLKNKLARLGGLSGGLVDEVVGKLVKYRFFNEPLFREKNILTSKAIQTRFFEATKRRKNLSKNDFWLLNGVNVNINHHSTVVNGNINAQSKRKLNKSKVKNKGIGDKSPPLKSFKNFSENEFIEEIRLYQEDFPKEMLNSFFKYWKERSPGGKMRFQLEKTWETKLRLEKWKTNELKFNQEKLKNGTGKISGTVNQVGATIKFDAP